MQAEQGSGNILNGWRKRYQERNIKVALFKSSALEKGRGFLFLTTLVVYDLTEGGTMAKNDRFVVKHEEGWAVKKTKAGRASSVHETQREAEKRAKEIVGNLGGGGKSGFKVKAGHSEIPTRRHAAMILIPRAIVDTESKMWVISQAL